jgi:hypothetical protein
MNAKTFDILLIHYAELKGVINDKPLVVALLVLLGFAIAWMLQAYRMSILNERIRAKDDEIWRYKAKLQGRTPDDIHAIVKRLTRRRITPQTHRAALTYITRPRQGERLNIIIAWRGGIGEIEELAEDFVTLFRDAGWIVSGRREYDVTYLPGIQVHLREPEDPIDRNLRETVALTKLNPHVHNHAVNKVPRILIGPSEDAPQT